MPRVHKPKGGSLQVWPRKRARRHYTRVRSYPKKEDIKLQGFAGYKAGMTHIQVKNPNTRIGGNIFIPATIIECPPLKVFSVRFYQSTPYGKKVISELHSPKINKELSRKIKIPKTPKTELKNIDDVSDISLLVYTQPNLTNIGKKKPDLFEIMISGKDPQQKFEYAKSLLDKEINIADILKNYEFIDAHSVTIGKGMQGAIKRFGISLKSHKAEKKRRSAGNLGAWTPSKVSWTVPQKGQMGYHTRTDYNKLILKISTAPEEINQKGGILHYGVIKNPYILLKGSIPGPSKRLIRLIPSIRNKKPAHPLEITYISQESKQ